MYCSVYDRGAKMLVCAFLGSVLSCIAQYRRFITIKSTVESTNMKQI